MTMRRLIVAVAAVSLGVMPSWQLTRAQQASPPVEMSEHFQHAAQLLLPHLQQVAAQVARRDNRIELREAVSAAFGLTVLNQDRGSVSRIFQMVLDRQVMNPNAPDFGDLPWNLFNDDVHDGNSIEFGTIFWGPLLLGYSGDLPPATLHDVKAHIPAALASLKRHNPPVSYTNIYLMNAINRLLLAEAVGLRPEESEATARLQLWLDYTAHTGIHEFQSPTYYGTDLESLTLCARYATSPEAKNACLQTLDVLWKDIAASYLPAAHRLVGPHSRDYDFLRGKRGLQPWIYAAGIGALEAPPSVSALADMLPGGYSPTPQALKLGSYADRIVQSSWDTDPFATRYLWITPDFAIGSAGKDYGPQDKLFAFDFPDPDTVTVTLMPDVYNSPYGIYRHPDHSGHLKQSHLKHWVSSVQDRGLVLFDQDLNPQADAQGSFGLADNLVLPASADEATLDGKPMDLSHAVLVKGKIGSVIGLRKDSGCFAAMPYHSDPFNNAPPEVIVEVDSPALANHAARLGLVYATTELHTSQTHLRIGWIFLAQHCEANGGLAATVHALTQSSISDKTDHGVWTTSVAVGTVHLELKKDINSRATLAATIDGKPVTAPIYVVKAKP